MLPGRFEVPNADPSQADPIYSLRRFRRNSEGIPETVKAFLIGSRAGAGRDIAVSGHPVQENLYIRGITQIYPPRSRRGVGL